MSGTCNRNILIVEDEEDLLLIYSKYAEKIFSNIFRANNKHSAKLILKNEKIHCIVTDNRLPDGTGISLALETNAIEKKIPVILMTGYADKETAIESVNTHLFYFLEKPFSKDTFTHVLEKCSSFLESRERDDHLISAYHIKESTLSVLKEKYQLSKREMEIISRAMRADSNSVIGEELFISTGTVKKHFYNIFGKMNISSKAELKKIIYNLNKS